MHRGEARSFGSVEEAEQAWVTVEDARDEATRLARDLEALTAERDGLLAENARLRRRLGEEQHRLASRARAAQEVRDRFGAAVAAADADLTRLAAEREDLQLCLEELQVTAEELSEANLRHAALNARLNDQVAARTADLAAANAALEARERARLVLVAELNHRVKNSLVVVQSVAAQTMRLGGVPPEVQASLTARLVALARSHDLLTRREWTGAPLAEVLARTLAPHGPEERFRIWGPPVELPAAAVVTASLAFHELATNAVKHGALSVPQGRVDIRWALAFAPDRPDGAVALTWREIGGPPVQPPARRGFGTRLIEQGLAREFGGEVELDFDPRGVRCHLRLPVAKAG